MAKDKSGATMAGGCLCGAVRYEIRGAPIHVLHCHCRMCQRASGAPLMTWSAVEGDRFTLTQGAPTTYASSSLAQRQFCPVCGSQLFFEYSGPRGGRGLVYFTVTTLDHPERLTPERHIWTSSRQPWLRLADTLPEHEEEP